MRETRLATTWIFSEGGVRSCQEGGEWDFVLDERSQRRAIEDVKRMRTRYWPQAEWPMWLAEFRKLMAGAEAGTLTFDRSNTKGIVCRGGKKLVDEGVLDVLEARLESCTLDDEQRNVRLYFSEPADLPRILVAISVRDKPCAGNWSEVQDDHMREAQRLLDDWFTTQHL